MKFRTFLAASLACSAALFGSSCESMQGLFGKKEPPAQVPDPYGGYGQTNPAGAYQGYEQQPQQGGYGQGTAPQQGYGGYTPPAGGGYQPPANNPYDTGGGNTGGTDVASGGGGGGRTHVVAKGDSLFALSRRYKSSVDSIMRANNLTNPDKIVIGQKLTIP